METSPPQSPQPRAKLPPKLATLVEQYGRLAIWVFVALSLTKWAIVLTAVFLGVEFDAATTAQQTAGFLGKLGIAWAVSRVGMPFQLAATVVLTPLVAKVLERRRRPRPQP